MAAEVLPGKKITRFAIFTKENGHYTFSTRDNKATLRAVREHVPADRLQKSENFFQVAGHVRGPARELPLLRRRAARRP